MNYLFLNVASPSNAGTKQIKQLFAENIIQYTIIHELTHDQICHLVYNSDDPFKLILGHRLRKSFSTMKLSEFIYELEHNQSYYFKSNIVFNDYNHVITVGYNPDLRAFISARVRRYKRERHQH